MKVAANILMAGMLLFGFATFALILRIPQSSEYWGAYLFLLLSLTCGIALYANYALLRKKHEKLNAKCHTLSEAVVLAQKVESKNENKEANNDKNQSTNTAKIADSVQKIDDLKKDADKVLSIMAKAIPFSHGLIYITDEKKEDFQPIGKYAYYSETEPEPFKIGEGINGQVAKDMQPFTINDLPDDYVNIVSGLGHAQPKYITINPVVKDSQTVAICELGFLKTPSDSDLQLIKFFCDSLVEKVSLN